MIFKKIVTPNIFHKVRQLESLSKTGLFVNSCKLQQLSRTSTSLTNTKQCLNSNIFSNGNNHLAKFPTTGTLGTQICRKGSTTTGDHVRLWVIERIAAAALPIIIPAALISESVILDGIMSVLVVMHSHWGLEAIITDYARPSVVGPVLPKVLHLSLILLSAATLCGLFILINNGPGVSRAIKDGWAIGKTPPKDAQDTP
ncbi:Putative succinate dehydrogenase [ubiquinone] cytochrome b small subunit, mitochondrial [Habropoda laboriosa]|uniref:Succinate dehydrogenase [ubiquinone] cytochrome b small subunit n=1 Tax=Habropoda laboriosa TaxID=597456 RepID=A0A0L7R9T4_9HYME|nr:PREDICTED: succinate dehydrogenase [ubiquinone] cytochrome b small subunit, mitochondrial [Habropoda laboriosa]KOC67599.1 Putative succinate dehydrogenase [ubiquinone] cytochrome b small subunit, mitochondrial [Habropoda laboriosa]